MSKAKMSIEARDLFAKLAREGKAPARQKKAVAELIARGLAAKAEKGLCLTLAGQFAASAVKA